MRVSVICGLLLLFCFVDNIYGHGKMVLPVPRAGSGGRSDLGDKLQPFPATAANITACGGTANKDPGPLAIQNTYQAGQTISIVWKTTITHDNAPGVRIMVRYTTTEDFTVLADALQIGADGCHNTTVTLPATRTSNNAVIQWLWQSQSDGGFYIGCADVKIQTAAVVPTDTNNVALYQEQCLGASSGGSGSGSGSGSSGSYASRIEVFGVFAVIACLVALLL